MAKTVKTSEATKVAIYARVSTQEQAAEGTSLEFQSEQLTAYCRSLGWEIFREYVDAGYSGKDGDRPELKRLLSDAKFSLFNKVVVYKLDRLARKLRLLLELEEQLREYSIALHSVKDSMDTSTAMGRTVFQMFGLVAEWERETIVERTKSGRMQRYKQGCWAAGRPLYGYLYNKETKKLEIDKSKVPIIRRIFQEYADGKSLFQVAKGLNSDSIPPRRIQARAWDASAVRDVLFNPAYKGTLIVNRYQPIAQAYKVDMSKAIIIKVPAIISDALWKAAERHRKDNKHVRPIRTAELWLLQGLVTCGLCGHSFKITLVNKKRRCYTCRGRLKVSHLDESAKCTCPSLAAKKLEDLVSGRIKAITDDPKKLESMIRDTVDRLKNREAELNALIRPIDEQLSKIAEKKRRMADDWVKLNMDDDKYRKLQQSLDKEESRLKGIRTEIDPKQLEELEQTREMLKLWERDLRAMSFNTVDEQGRVQRNVELPHQDALKFKIVGVGGKDISKDKESLVSREDLDRLGVRLVAFSDRVEVKAVFEVEPIPTTKDLLCSSAC